jgi:two-component system NtrC family response regulator
VIQLEVPALKDRTEDIPLLVAHFVEKFQTSEGKKVELAPEVWKVLYSYSWPGNIRELENTIEGALVMSVDDTITLKDLPAYMLTKEEEEIDFDKIVPQDLTLDKALEHIEEKLIVRALKSTDNVQSRAAEMLGISRHSMHYKMKKYGMIS